VRYLLDTSIVSEPVKPRPRNEILVRLRETESECAIAAPVWHELRFGVLQLRRSKRREVLEHYIEGVVRAAYPILPYDEAAAERHARERARLEASGRVTAWVDGQIAAIALSSGLVLVTLNRRHFAPFADLKVETWAAS
jgi:tRNA(fMet)-specific endonuclease VapC